MVNILITICARGGSKGIPGKNIKNLNGKPLIYYTLSTALEYRNSINESIDIILSTDDEEIREVVRAGNFEVDSTYKRPEELATDNAGKLDAIIDVLQFAQKKHLKVYDFVIDLDVTSPLRTASDLNLALTQLQSDTNAYNIFSVNIANRNPYFNIVEQKEDGYYTTCKKGAFLTRQSAPPVFDMNASFYIYRDSFFNKGFISALTDKSLIFEMKHICFDLDHPIDFDFMEYLLLHNKLGFTI